MDSSSQSLTPSLPPGVSEGALIFLLVVASAHATLAMGWFFMRRTQFPVSGRDAGISVGIGVVMLVAPCAGVAAVLINTPCGWMQALADSMGLLAVNFVAARAVRVWLLHEISSERIKADGLNQEEIDQLSIRWKERYAKWFKFGRLAGVVCGVSLVQMLVVWILFILNSAEGLNPQAFECNWTSRASIFLYASEVPITLFCAYTAKKLHHIDDNFGLKEELKYLTVAGASFFVVLLVTLLTMAGQLNMIFYIRAIVYCVGYQLLVIISFDVPVLRSYRKYKGTPANTSRRVHSGVSSSSTGGLSSSHILKPHPPPPGGVISVPTLREILHSPNSKEYESLKQHLINEFNVEEFRFVVAVKKFKKRYPAATVATCAAHIRTTTFPTKEEEETETEIEEGEQLGEVEEDSHKIDIAEASAREGPALLLDDGLGGGDRNDFVGPNNVKSTHGGNINTLAPAVTIDVGNAALESDDALLGGENANANSNESSMVSIRGDDEFEMCRIALVIFFLYVDRDGVTPANLPFQLHDACRDHIAALVDNFEELHERTKVVAETTHATPFAARLQIVNLVRHWKVSGNPDRTVFDDCFRCAYVLIRDDPFTRWTKKWKDAAKRAAAEAE